MTKPPKNYEVGYGKPPKSGQFQKGISGNPRGRPKGSRRGRIFVKTKEGELSKIILREGNKKIKIMENGEPVEMRVIETIVRSNMVNAMKGHVYAQRTALTLYKTAESNEIVEQNQNFEFFLAHKRGAKEELDRRERNGIMDGPPIVPHPDNIVVDVANGTLQIYGPLSVKEHYQLQTIQDFVDMHLASLEKHKAKLVTAVDPLDIESIKNTILLSQRVIDDFNPYLELMKRPRSIDDEVKSIQKILSAVKNGESDPL